MKEVRDIQFIMRATLTDGTVIEGATRTCPDSVVEEEDARFFGYIEEAVRSLGINPSRTKEEAYVVALYTSLRGAPIRDKLDNDAEIRDLLELTFIRMLRQLRQT